MLSNIEVQKWLKEKRFENHRVSSTNIKPYNITYQPAKVSKKDLSWLL